MKNLKHQHIFRASDGANRGGNAESETVSTILKTVEEKN